MALAGRAFQERGSPHEQAHLPAAQQEPEADPRVSRPHGHDRGPEHHPPSPVEGPDAPGRHHPLQAHLNAAPAPEQLERLKRSADFQRVQGHGRRIRTPHLLLVAAVGEGVCTRVGWAVSRKVGGAVQRNRVKRWLREATRAARPPASGPWDLVLIPRSEAVDAGLRVLSAEVAELFRRVGR